MPGAGPRDDQAGACTGCRASVVGGQDRDRGLVDSRAFGPEHRRVVSTFRVFTVERAGHGHTADVRGPITYELMGQDTIAFDPGCRSVPAVLV